MAITVLIPNALQRYVGGAESVEVEGNNVGEALRSLADNYPDLTKHIYSETGELRQFVNVYVGNEDMRNLSGEQTQLADVEELTIVPSIAGGLDPVGGDPATVDLSKDEILRYSRHLIMPEVALEGQKRLKAAKVLCIGAGGLGSPLALYLAAAGVGTLGIVEFDVVDYTNLQRQIIHGTEDVGRPKLQSATDTLKSINRMGHPS